MSLTAIDTRAFIAGVRTVCAHSEPLRSPHDATPLAQVHVAGPQELERALAAGHACVKPLSAVPSFQRQRWLFAIADGIDAQRALFVDTIVAEAAKPRRFAQAEVARAIETFRLAAMHCGHHQDSAMRLDTVPQGQGRFGVVTRMPVGLVSAVAPFNFPLNLVAHKLAPALACGCPVVLKPASQTPLSALLLASVYEAAGVLPGALSVTPATRADADVLVTDPRPKLLTFTGSPEVGFAMKARAGKKKVVLELGGDAASVIFADADIAHAVDKTVAGAFAYAGQVCISVQRILVQRSVYDDVKRQLVSRTQAVVVGDPSDINVDMSALIDHKNAARVRAWVNEAIARGAVRLCGADGDINSNIVPPTLLEHVADDCTLAQNEVFGPVAAIAPFDDVDDAIAQVNRSRFGLQVGVFTRDIDTLWRMHNGCEVGGVIHNDAPTFRVDNMPYGGVKDSGLMREGIPAAFDDYTEPRLLVLSPR